MLLEDARQIINENIFTNGRHIDYPRTVEIDEDALIYTTGEGIGKMIVKVIHRESEEAHKQRVRIYGGITTELFGSLETPINEVLQNEMVRRGIRLDNERQRILIEDKFKHWGSGSFIESGGWDNWQTGRYKDLQGHSPNTWIIEEWNSPQSPADVVYVQPFEVPAAWAYNFELENDKTTAKWLLVGQPIKYLKRKKAEEVKQKIYVEGANGKQFIPPFIMPEYLQHLSVDGIRYTLYTDTDAIVYEQIDRDYYLSQNEDVQTIEIKPNHVFAVRVYPHKLGHVPAFRVGYLDDPMTAGRTKVPFWHRAKPAFKDSVIKVSQMDIAELVQNFPRPTRYVTQCKGTDEYKCDGGWQAGTSPRIECKACHGEGVKTIKNPAEEIVIPLPVDATNETILDLSKLTHWDAPPQAPFDHMREVIKDITFRAHRAVWGSDMLIRTDGVTKTATEDENDQRQIQTGLLPLAKHISTTYKFVAYTFASLSGADVSKVSVYYEFQGQLYRRGINQLLAQRAIAVTSGASADYIAELDKTIADIQYAGDPVGRRKREVQDYFRPFAGMSMDSILYAIEKGKVENFYIVLWSNYDAIFKELELDTPGFYYITDKNVQWVQVEAKVNEFIVLIGNDTPEVTLPALGNSVVV